MAFQSGGFQPGHPSVPGGFQVRSFAPPPPLDPPPDLPVFEIRAAAVFHRPGRGATRVLGGSGEGGAGLLGSLTQALSGDSGPTALGGGGAGGASRTGNSGVFGVVKPAVSTGATAANSTGQSATGPAPSTRTATGKRTPPGGGVEP